LEFLDIDTTLNGEHSEVELGHGKAEAVEDARFPVLREALIGKHRLEISNAAAENGQHGGGAVRE
jgi:hypothetical protein